MKNTTHKISFIVALLLSSQFMTGCKNAANISETLNTASSSVPDQAPFDSVPTPSPSVSETLAEPETALLEGLKQVVPLWEAKVAGSKEWTTHVDRELDRLGKNLLDVIPKDRNLFCPRYDKLSYAQRKQYWTFLLSAMVRFESNFKSSLTYKEAFNDSKGKPVISRGLLQISIESGNAYGCGFKTAKDVHDPLQNLSCGIRILDRWLDRDGRIGGKVSGQWRGGARYWAVLRAGDKTSYKSIVSWSQNLSFCK